jgi:uncharacterized protein (UPF0333 family)
MSSKGQVAPEFQLVNDASITTFQNTLYSLIQWSYKRKDRPSLSKVMINLNSLKQRANKANELIDYLDLTLTGNQLPADVKTVLTNYISNIPKDSGSSKGVTRSIDALYLVMGSPYYLIQR